MNLVAEPINPFDLVANMQFNTRSRIPFGVCQHQLLGVTMREVLAQPHAIIGGSGFLAKSHEMELPIDVKLN